jgi:hypothetical protein
MIQSATHRIVKTTETWSVCGATWPASFGQAADRPGLLTSSHSTSLVPPLCGTSQPELHRLASSQAASEVHPGLSSRASPSSPHSTLRCSAVQILGDGSNDRHEMQRVRRAYLRLSCWWRTHKLFNPEEGNRRRPPSDSIDTHQIGRWGTRSGSDVSHAEYDQLAVPDLQLQRCLRSCPGGRGPGPHRGSCQRAGRRCRPLRATRLCGCPPLNMDATTHPLRGGWRFDASGLPTASATSPRRARGSPGTVESDGPCE